MDKTRQGKWLYYNSSMTVRPKMQVDVSNKVKARAKAVAADREITLSQLVLVGLSKVGDEKLSKLIKEELENKKVRGRPTKE